MVDMYEATTGAAAPDDWGFLHAGIDLAGNPIAVGTRVRAFDFPSVVRDQLSGLDLDGERACFCEGVVEAIGEVMEGCPRYRIRTTRVVFGGSESPVDGDHRTIWPPVNGAPQMFGRHPTFGVVALGG